MMMMMMMMMIIIIIIIHPYSTFIPIDKLIVY